MSFNIISFLSPLGSFLLSAEIASSAGLWELIITYGLGQPYAFPYSSSDLSIITPLFKHITNELAIPISLLAIFLSSIKIIMIRKGEDLNRIFWRMSLGLLLFFLSLDISRYILEFSYLVFNSVWSFGSINWISSMTSSQILSYLGNMASGGNTLSALLLSSGYFAATFILLSFLMLRDALLIVFIILLPLVSLLMAVTELYERMLQLWVMFIELALIPFPIAIALYLSSVYSNIFFMHLAFLWAACLIPSIFMTKGGLFRNLMSLDILSGVNLVGNRMQLITDRLPNVHLGNISTGGEQNGMANGNNPYQININDLMKKDVEYRRTMWQD